MSDTWADTQRAEFYGDVRKRRADDMATLQVNVSSDDAAIADDPRGEFARILRSIANFIEGEMHDHNRWLNGARLQWE